MRTAKTLIRLGRCPGWSESSLGAQPWNLIQLSQRSKLKSEVSLSTGPTDQPRQNLCRSRKTFICISQYFQHLNCLWNMLPFVGSAINSAGLARISLLPDLMSGKCLCTIDISVKWSKEEQPGTVPAGPSLKISLVCCLQTQKLQVGSVGCVLHPVQKKTGHYFKAKMSLNRSKIFAPCLKKRHYFKAKMSLNRSQKKQKKKTVFSKKDQKQFLGQG